MQNLQTFIANFDFTALSAGDQLQVTNLFNQILALTLRDFISNPNTTQDQINSVLSPISAAQVANKIQVSQPVQATP